MGKKIKEDVAYGIYDRPGPSKQDAEVKDEDLTLGEELPLQPLDQMRNQLTVQRPPIEDENFVPGSVEELSRAAAAISSLVPSSQIEKFYSSLHRLLDACTDHQEQTAAPEKDAVSVAENYFRKAIRKVLTEVLSDDDVDELDAYRGRSYDTGGIDYFGDKDLEDEMKSASSGEKIKSKSDGTVSLDQIASEFGYSGASGVRQEIKRLTDRLKYFVTSVKREDLDALLDYASGEYVDLMQTADLMDAEDADFLRSNPSGLKRAESFRFFFVASFIMPAYRQITRESTRSLYDEIKDLGIPESLHQTVFNQVTGASQQGTIAKKLASMAKKGTISREEALNLVKKIESSLPALSAASDKSDEIVQLSLDKWQSSSKKKKIAAIKQAVGMIEEG